MYACSFGYLYFYIYRYGYICVCGCEFILFYSQLHSDFAVLWITEELNDFKEFLFQRSL